MTQISVSVIEKYPDRTHHLIFLCGLKADFCDRVKVKCLFGVLNYCQFMTVTCQAVEYFRSRKDKIIIKMKGLFNTKIYLKKKPKTF